ncbi:hypothetical protein ElyMa_001969500 [Elysia marginata]|uniref:Uncharacterized protein n=1 Tax=Elysia marginata TaxID=1093978 RepID=A0AAV4F124_9GAST|nr:hypothetical protein ElyMa_001969500 [Elysia marginata]
MIVKLGSARKIWEPFPPHTEQLLNYELWLARSLWVWWASQGLIAPWELLGLVARCALLRIAGLVGSYGSVGLPVVRSLPRCAKCDGPAREPKRVELTSLRERRQGGGERGGRIDTGAGVIGCKSRFLSHGFHTKTEK